MNSGEGWQVATLIQEIIMATVEHCKTVGESFTKLMVIFNVFQIVLLYDKHR
jgi:hypothetical protein